MIAEPGRQRYPHVFSPFRLGSLELANRLVVPGLTTNFGNPDGSVSDELCEYLGRRAAGGFGLVTTENVGVHAGARALPRMIMGHEDRFIPGLKRLAAAVKAAGVPAIAQINHPGRQTKSSIAGMELVAPSPIPCPLNREMPRALSLDEVAAYEQAYVDAAARLAEAGFDGIEVHAAHGYLVAEFLSRYANAREDRYGGPLANRLRFLLNIVDGIRGRLGADFPLVVRISAREFVENGLDVAESIEIGRALAAHGVDALSLSVGVYESFNKVSMVSGEPEGQWLDLAAAVRKEVPLPVIGVGRIIRAEVAEAALAEGKIDLAALGRASMADPELPRKVRLGREDRVMICMGCNICLGRSSRPESICPINPALGREAAFDLGKTPEPRRLALIGASYSALTAAWVAAERGHQVTLFDGDGPGGLMLLRARVRVQQGIAEVTEALLARALGAGVERRPGAPADSDFDVVWAVERFAPVDPRRPRREVRVSCAAEVLGNGMPPGGGPIVVVGDDLCAAETALWLAEGGEAAGAVVERRVSEPFAHAALAAAEWLVLGRGPDAGWDDAANWLKPELPFEVGAYLKDAYEPGHLTRAVYEAADMARGL
jgi:2,4-dienoyl-CoA reductase-like NADH-dependent reductase (Old Yellow Enzyme family)